MRPADVTDPDDPPTGRLKNVVISAHGCHGLEITTLDGRPATMAVLDQGGNIVEQGAALAEEMWSVAILAYRHFLKGEGTLTVYSSPQGLTDPDTSEV